MTIQKQVFLKEIENIVRQLIYHYFPEKIILFGSCLKEDAEPADIDLFIVKKNPPYLGADRIRELDKIIKYNIATDFIVYTPDEFNSRVKAGDPFVNSILKEGKILYERK